MSARILANDERLLFHFLVACQVAIVKRIITKAEYEIFTEGRSDVKELLKIMSTKLANPKIIILMGD